MVSGTHILAGAVVAFGIVYQFFIQPVVYHTLGVHRPIEAINNKQCTRIKNLHDACEDAWLHQPSGKLYLACSPPLEKFQWFPNQAVFNVDKAGTGEYVAIYDSKGDDEGKITRVTPKNFDGHDGKGTLMLHGMGVYHGTDGLGNDDTVRLFLINHRVQADAKRLGAASTVELFETKLGSDTMTHIKTFSDPAIFTPNNLLPTGPDSFYFSNDNHVKTGHLHKMLNIFFPLSSLGHCDAKTGCKIVADKIKYPNGIAGAQQYPSKQPDVLYQASTGEGVITVYDIQADKSLTVKDRIKTGYPMDNLNILPDQSLIVTAFPHMLSMGSVLGDPDTKVISPTAVLRISKNTGKDSFYGQKYKVEKVFEDDGKVYSGATNAALDTERGLLFISGVVTPHVSICKVPV